MFRPSAINGLCSQRLETINRGQDFCCIVLDASETYLKLAGNVDPQLVVDSKALQILWVENNFAGFRLTCISVRAPHVYFLE